MAVTGKNDSGKRADRIIRTVLSDIALSSVYKEMRSGRIRINGKKIKPDYRVKEGDIINIHTSLLNDSAALNGKDISIAIKKKQQIKNSTVCLSDSKRIKYSDEIFNAVVFENNNILAVNKKRGIPVHGGDFSASDKTLEESVKKYLEGKISDSITFRPGPLHRLDRNTSGIILFGKSIEGARVFSEMLRTGRTEKYYIALFDGVIKEETRWENKIYQDKNMGKSYSADIKSVKNTHNKPDNSIKAKEAVTIVKPIIYSDKNTLAAVIIPTGRYHQIRKQGQLNNHPLTGDKKYGGNQNIPFYLLHAFKLVLKQQSEITGFNSIISPLPDYFYKTAGKLFNRKDVDIFRDFIKNFSK